MTRESLKSIYFHSNLVSNLSNFFEKVVFSSEINAILIIPI